MIFILNPKLKVLRYDIHIKIKFYKFEYLEELIV